MPNQRHSVDERSSKMLEAIGRCMMAWARVELQLSLMWTMVMHDDAHNSDAIWTSIRSLDAKVAILNKVALRTLGDKETDWPLVRTHIMAIYKKRNQVAHATMLTGTDGDVYIEPFFAITKPNKLLSANDLDGYSAEFERGAEAIHWIRNVKFLPASLRPELLILEPDLMPRLRTEDARMREAQRHRNLAWRQYLQNNPNLKL